MRWLRNPDQVSEAICKIKVIIKARAISSVCDVPGGTQSHPSDPTDPGGRAPYTPQAEGPPHSRPRLCISAFSPHSPATQRGARCATFV